MTNATEPGIQPPSYRLPGATRLGPVRLQVSDLERSLQFYRDIIGLREIRSDGAAARTDNSRRAVLAAGGSYKTPEDGDRSTEPSDVLTEAPASQHPANREATPALIELVERPGAEPVGPRGHLGLFHVAILLPDRRDLGRFIRHAADAGIRLGMADHLVSEAVYLSDPDGLGLEVYADRPRETWEQQGEELRMTTDPLDVRSLIQAAGGESWRGAPAGTTVGHVHLHVGDLEAAAAFYHDALGFDKIVWSYPGALFMSAGGYHHHLGTNTWARGASPAGESEARLVEWTVLLPDAAEVKAARSSLEKAGYAVTSDASGWTAPDPWGTVVRVTSDE